MKCHYRWSQGKPLTEGGGIEVCKFSAIFRNFPQFFCNCFRPVHFACLLVPFASANNCCRTICLNVFPASKKSVLCFNFMVILRAACLRNSDTCGRFNLFQHSEPDSEAPVQNCCSLRLREVQFGLVTTPQFSRNFPQFSRNFSQLDWTLPDRNPPPPLPLRWTIQGSHFGCLHPGRA